MAPLLKPDLLTATKRPAFNDTYALPFPRALPCPKRRATAATGDTTRMQEPAITPELIENHGLISEEYQLIREIIGREPTFTELGTFSAMWNEHCSY